MAALSASVHIVDEICAKNWEGESQVGRRGKKERKDILPLDCKGHRAGYSSHAWCLGLITSSPPKFWRQDEDPVRVGSGNKGHHPGISHTLRVHSKLKIFFIKFKINNNSHATTLTVDSIPPTWSLLTNDCVQVSDKSAETDTENMMVLAFYLGRWVGTWMPRTQVSGLPKVNRRLYKDHLIVGGHLSKKQMLKTIKTNNTSPPTTLPVLPANWNRFTKLKFSGMWEE